MSDKNNSIDETTTEALMLLKCAFKPETGTTFGKYLIMPANSAHKFKEVLNSYFPQTSISLLGMSNLSPAEMENLKEKLIYDNISFEPVGENYINNIINNDSDN